jgi:Xaa-Pro aminopeptidase
MFSKEIYVKRRDHLRKQFSKGKLLFLGNDESGMNYADNTYHFRQDSTFLYYFGIDIPGLYAIMDIDEGRDYIFGDDYTIDSIVWMGPQPTIKELAEQVGVKHTGSVAQLTDRLNKYPRGAVEYLPPYRPEHQLKLMRFLGVNPAASATGASIPFITAVAEQRNIKSEEEIQELEVAVSVTADMHLAAMRYAKPGMTEAQVAARIAEVALAAGGNLAFPIIATINGQTLHNHYHGNTIREGQLFLVDAGYETTLGYAGDMSSTFPVGKKFTERQKEIYRIALAAHNGAIDMLKPGVHFRDVHFQCARVIFDGLKDLGFTRGNTDDAVANGAHALFFPCGTGHMMGLDVHDMENLGEQWVGYCGEPKSTQFGLKSLRLGRKLMPGFVLTIEPGIYFIPQLIDLWQKNGINKDFINFDRVNEYRNFGGIRNEEDVLITPAGHRVLGKPLAKSIEEVEAEREKAFE